VAEYYPCESIEDLENDVLRITLRTADTRWVERLLLRLGGSGQVVEPADLAERVRNKAMAALAVYDAA
jgi:proteasome accessory factor C